MRVDDTDFEFTDVFLAREVLGDTGPSPAAGISSETLALEQSAAADTPVDVIWLIEPQRSAVVDRWSGTMQHPNYSNNKIGQTISTFAHFSLIYSGKTLVLVDLQSKRQASVLRIILQIITLC